MLEELKDLYGNNEEEEGKRRLKTNKPNKKSIVITEPNFREWGRIGKEIVSYGRSRIFTNVEEAMVFLKENYKDILSITLFLYKKSIMDVYINILKEERYKNILVRRREIPDKLSNLLFIFFYGIQFQQKVWKILTAGEIDEYEVR